jgi:hypothetical protein
VRASFLAFLSAFQFPQTAVVFPFWGPQQCRTATCIGAFSNFKCFLSIFNTFSPKLEVPSVSGHVFNESVQIHYCISTKTCIFLDKALAIHEILNI